MYAEYRDIFARNILIEEERQNYRPQVMINDINYADNTLGRCIKYINLRLARV